LAGFIGRKLRAAFSALRRLHGAAGREDAVRIGDADDLVKLEEIDVIGLESAQ
jgi:hypothetical protein